MENFGDNVPAKPKDMETLESVISKVRSGGGLLSLWQ